MMEDKIAELEAEIARLKEVVKTMTEALKVLTEKEERAAAFVARIEAMLNQ